MNILDPSKRTKVRKLRKQNKSLREIERQTGVNRETIAKYTPQVTRSEAMTRFHAEQRKRGVKQRRVRFEDLNIQEWERDALALAILRSRGPLQEDELVDELNKAIVWIREIKLNVMLLRMLLHGKICGSVVSKEMVFKPLPKSNKCQSTQK